MPTPGNVRRILMTADAVGGVWSYSMDLATALRARGIDVTVAVMGPRMDSAQQADAAARGIDVVHAPYRLEWMDDPWEDVERAGPWLLSLADRLQPDLVHLNGFCHAALPWSVPTVVVAHSCVKTWWRGVHGEEAPGCWDAYADRVAAGLRAASLVLAPTRALLDEVLAVYGPVAAAGVIPNGSRAVERPLPSAAKEPMVLSAGRLWDEAKNVASVCAVASSLSWPLYLAGDLEGPSQCFVPWGAARYLGRLPAAELARWYERAAIYALPARYEPFGLSVVEAAAAGCALVLGDIRTLRENWTGAALFVPPDNRRALAAAIEQLAHDDAHRAELGRRARQRAAAFTVDRMAEAYVAAYNSLLVPAAAA
ncbi:MAG TPA: glycosyltransferase family 4 protein [Vicinamibacterales bacterium]|nr:glycosyltransferase family 4 protein [Vicinamibacterales bacterium]